MGNKLLRMVLAVLTLAITVQWSRPALAAPLVINGTVGEIGVLSGINGAYWVRFKLTNANATAACADYNYNGQDLGVTGYAWFYDNDNTEPTHKEWYAQLLYSKKGAPITCTLSNDAYGCRVTSCVLP